MKMNSIRWIRRIFACVILFCLTVSGVQPAQASPPARGNNILSLTFIQVPPRPACLWKTYKIKVAITVEYQAEHSEKNPLELGQLAAFPDGWVKGTAKVGALLPAEYPIVGLWRGKTQTFNFTYTVVSEGRITLSFDAYVTGGGGEQDKRLYVDATVCEDDVHASVDLTNVSGGMDIEGWEPVGTYDIAGTIKLNEDGTTTGQAVASLYEDIFFTGGDDEITCEHTSPWQGNSPADIEADPTAWANEGMLQLTFALEPMQVNTTRVECEGPDDASGYANSPPISIASFDLKFDALPAEGGSTNLGFQFPGGQGEFEMQLIVSPVEAES